MLCINGVDLTKVVSFNSASIDFTESLTYIRGVNKDSDPVRPTGNGVGKSLFFSAIPNVWYSSTPMSIKKKARKDLLSKKGSSIGLIYRPREDGPEYEIIQTAGKYLIYEDGKDLKIPTIPKAEAFLRKIFPLSEVDWYSRCYISTQRPYSLLRSSDSERLQHIIDIAMLDQYSDIHKYFSVQASGIKDNEIRLSVLEQQQNTIKDKLKKAKSDISKEQYAEIKKQYSKLDAEIKKSQGVRFELLSRQQALESLIVIEKELDGLRSEYKFKQKPSVQLKVLKADKSNAREWVSYDENLVHIEKVQRKLRAKLDELKPKLSSQSPTEILEALKDRKQKLSGLEAEIESLEEQKEKIESSTSELAEMQEAFDALEVGDDFDPNEDYASTLAEIRLRLKLEDILKHEEVHADQDSGTCPTCKSDIDFANIRRIVKMEKKKLAKYLCLKKAQDIRTAMSPLKKLLKGSKFSQKQLSRLVKDREKLDAEIVELVESKEIAKQYASYKEQLSTLDTPTKPSTPRPKLSLEDIEKGIDLCHEIEKHLRAKATLIESNEDFVEFRSVKSVKEGLEVVSSELSVVEKRLRSVESDQATFAGQISSYDQYANTVKVYKEELAAVENELEKIRPLVEDKKLVTILTKAYGTKGLRSYAANAFCNLLQTNLNHYRDLIFAEPFEFIVEASDTGVSLLVDRNNGRSDSVSDVRHLSGAESECFALLCAASLITLTPDNRKLNMLVLDEPTSHLHPVSKELFTTKFLPFLTELVPSIFIIDNTDDPMFENSQQWTVVKHKGVSTLKLT